MSIHVDHNGVTVEENGTLHDYNIWADLGEKGMQLTELHFQDGPVSENGVNGLTNEALLAVLIHRTKGLNKLYPCRENSISITHMETALLWFEKRTSDRIERGVEGKNSE